MPRNKNAYHLNQGQEGPSVPPPSATVDGLLSPAHIEAAADRLNECQQGRRLLNEHELLQRARPAAARLAA